MNLPQPPAPESGWVEDPGAAPHLVLRAGIDHTSNAALVTVQGRAVLALPADGDSGLLRAVDLTTGTVLPDRSLLRYERHEVLALGAGRLLATLGPHRDTVVVRDAVTGSPVGVPIREQQQTRSLALTMVDGRPVVVTTGSGLALWDVATGELIGRHERIRGRHFVTYRGRLLLVAEASADSLRLHDVLTGQAVGHPIRCDFSLSVWRLAAAEHEGRLLVAFLDSHADTRVSLWDVTSGVELATVPPADDVRELALATMNGRPLLLVARSGKSGSPLMLWDPVAGHQVLPDFFAGYDGDCALMALESLDDGFFVVTAGAGAGPSELLVWAPEGRRRTVLADGAVWRLALGAVDGRPTIALGGAHGSLRLVDVRTGREFTSPCYGGPVDSGFVGTMDTAGRAVVILGGRPMRLWEVASGVPVARLNRSSDGITRSAAGELDGRTVVALVADGRGTDATLSVWDPAADALICEVSLAQVSNDRPAQAVAFTEIDGRTAVAVAVGRTVHVWDAATGEERGRPYPGVGKSILAMAAGRVGDRPVLAVGGKDQLVHVFDPATGAAVVPPLAGHSDIVTAVAVGAAHGRPVVISGSWDNTVRVWDAVTGAGIGGPWSGHGDTVRAVQVTEWNGEPVVVSHARSGPPRMWRLSAPAAGSGHTNAVVAVAAGRWEGRSVFASGSDDRTVRLWDAATGRSLGPALTDHAAAVTHVAFTGPGRDILVTGDESGVVLRWRSHAGVPVSEPLTSVGGRIGGIATAEADGRTVVGVGGPGGVLRTWDAVTGEPHTELRAGPAAGHADLGVLDGRLVALTISYGITDEGAVLTLWDVITGKPGAEPVAVPEESENLGAFATVDDRLAVIRGIDAGDGGDYHPEEAADVEVVDVATRTVLKRYRQKGGWTHHAIVSRSARGTVLLVAAEDEVVVDPFAADGEKSGYTGHRAAVQCLATAEVDGRTIVASGDRGNGLHFWDVDTCERLG
jgi:WD40 repeat protein